MNFKTFKTHFRMFFFGNKDFIEKGYAEIPCRGCNKIFKSYAKFKKWGTYDIDTKCEQCKITAQCCKASGDKDAY